MGLSDDDVREILRIIAETPLQELRLDAVDLRLDARDFAKGGCGEP